MSLGFRRAQLGHPLGQAERLGGVLERPVVEEAAEVLGQVAGPGVAAGGVGVDALADDRVEPPGDLRVEVAGRRGPPCRRSSVIILDHLEQRPARRRLGERVLAGDHLEEDQAQGVQVGPLVDGLGRGRALRG